MVVTVEQEESRLIGGEVALWKMLVEVGDGSKTVATIAPASAHTPCVVRTCFKTTGWLLAATITLSSLMFWVMTHRSPSQNGPIIPAGESPWNRLGSVTSLMRTGNHSTALELSAAYATEHSWFVLATSLEWAAAPMVHSTPEAGLPPT